MSATVWGKTIARPTDSRHQPGTDATDLYPLLAHMLDTVCVAGVLWDQWLSSRLRRVITSPFGSADAARSAVTFAAGIHDIGKCNPIFQGQMLARSGSMPRVRQALEREGFAFPELDDMEDPLSYNPAKARRDNLHRHEKVGCWVLSDRDVTPDLAADRWLDLVVLGHHGSFGLDYGPRRSRQATLLHGWNTGRWASQRELFITGVSAATGATLDDLRGVSVPSEVVILLSGLVVLADRIASNESSVNQSWDEQQAGRLSLDDPAGYVAARHLFLEKLASTEVGFPAPLSREDVLQGRAPRGVQKDAPTAERDAGLWTVMAPTGTGKTEAALLRHTNAVENLVFLLPTRSTTSAMMGRLSKTWGGTRTVASLAHGDAYLESFYTASRGVRDWSGQTGLIPTGFTKYGARLSTPVNVATIDQAVMAGLPMKWAHLRLLALANAHVVIDEAHLLDGYQIELLRGPLELLGRVGTRVTVLSATLPSWVKQTIEKTYTGGAHACEAAYPSSELTGDDRRPVDAECYEVDVEVVCTSDPVDTHVRWVAHVLAQDPGARVGVFVNQVRHAQRVARTLRDSLPPDVEVVCLHSRMLGLHRKQVVDHLLKVCGTQGGQARRVVVIGTQVVEMSLDIDLDIVSTDLCPAPSLVQRLGREWRDKSEDGMRRRGERLSVSRYPRMLVHVVVPNKSSDNDKPSLPYGELSCARTAERIDAHDRRLSFPDDVQGLVEASIVSMDDLSANMDDNEAAAVIDEASREVFAIMTGKQEAAELHDLWNNPTVKDFAALTRPSITEDAATRLIEHDLPPLVLLSDEPWLRDLGALPTGTGPGSTEPGFDLRLKKASVLVSRSQARMLDATGIEAMKIGSHSFGFFGPLPDGLGYDQLTGLHNAR